MSDDINFKSWNVGSLSEDGFERIKTQTGHKRVSRKKRRRTMIAVFYTATVCVLSAVAYLTTNSPEQQLASIRYLIEKEMQEHRNYKAYAVYDISESKNKEERHEIMVRD